MAALPLQRVGFSLQWLLLLWTVALWAQQLWQMGLVAPRHVESSWTRDQASVPCIGGWTLNHWTSREVSHVLFLYVEHKENKMS